MTMIKVKFGIGITIAGLVLSATGAVVVHQALAQVAPPPIATRNMESPATSSSAAATKPAAIRQDGTGGGLGNSKGNQIAMERTMRLIETLNQESLGDSLDHLDYVDNFYYPGYLSQSITPKPFNDIQVLLSNRRFVKVVAELAKQSPDEQSRLIVKYQKKYKDQYCMLFENFRLENNQKLANGMSDAFRISDGEGLPRTLAGTRHAYRAVLLAGAMVGHCRVWEDLQPVLVEPVAGYALERAKFDSGWLQKLEYQPLISKGIVAQVVYQLCAHADSKELVRVGLRKAVIGGAVTSAMVQTISVPDFRGTVTQYDVVRRFGARVDTSKGVTEYQFLTTSEVDVILKSAGIENPK